MRDERGPELPERIRVGLDIPFDGLFGDTAELRVLHEIVADPYSNYTQRELVDLTGLSDPSVRKGVRALVRQGILNDISKERRHPLYKAELGSKRLAALMFLAYASLDEKTGGNSMEDAIMEYCGSFCTSQMTFSVADEGTFVSYPHIRQAEVANDEGRFRPMIEEA
jgi:hypothetical protein